MGIIDREYELDELIEMMGWKPEELKRIIAEAESRGGDYDADPLKGSTAYRHPEDSRFPKVSISIDDPKRSNIEWRCALDHQIGEFDQRRQSDESVVFTVHKFRRKTATISQAAYILARQRENDVWMIEDIAFRDLAIGAESAEALAEQTVEFLKAAHDDMAEGRFPSIDMLADRDLSNFEKGGVRAAWPLNHSLENVPECTL